MWNTDPDTHRSVRSPAFFGPVTLSAALLTVSLFSTPIWSQFGWLEARAANTTLLVGAYGACIKLNNDTGVVGPTRWCSSSNFGYRLNINLNDTTMFQNWPTGSNDDNVILGLVPQPDTLAVREIITSGKSTLQIFHIIAAIAALLCVASLIAPAKWFNKGKGTLANFQRSGILTILLGGIAFVMAWIAFAVVLINILGGKSALNDIPGISANWPGSAAHWFILPSAILYIPPFCTVLLPTYVRPADQDDADAPMPLNQGAFAKMDDNDSLPGTPSYAGSINKAPPGIFNGSPASNYPTMTNAEMERRGIQNMRTN